MATLNLISSLLHEMYDGGRIKSTSLTLSQRDMLQYVKLGYANVMRNMWLSLNKGETNDEYYFFTGVLQPKTFNVEKGYSFKIVDMTDTPTIRMPQNNHIFEVRLIGEGCESMGEPIPQVQPGEAKFYTGADFSTYSFFELVGSKLRIYNAGDCVKEAEVLALYDDPDAEIPDDIGFDVIKAVLKDVFDVKTFDRVKIDDNSNQLIHEIKSRLGIAATQ